MTFLVKTHLILNPLAISFNLKPSTIPILNISTFNPDFFPGLLKYFHLPYDKNHLDFSMKRCIYYPLPKSVSPLVFPNLTLLPMPENPYLKTTPCFNNRQIHVVLPLQSLTSITPLHFHLERLSVFAPSLQPLSLITS